VAGERGKRERLDELNRRRRHDDVNLKRLTLQGSHQFRRFVGGNSAGDADCDSHASIVEQWTVNTD
jgi:hypothetical protein